MQREVSAANSTHDLSEGRRFLYVRYDLSEIRRNAPRDSVLAGPKSMWRYAPVLPDAEPVTLGEGFTPMLPSRKYANLLIKDEGLNPTG